MSRIKWLGIGVLTLCVILGGVGVYQSQIHQNKKIKEEFNWTDQQQSVVQALNNSDLVLIGQVKSGNSYEMNHVVFTDYTIEVEKILRGSPVSQQPKVSLTGGTYNGIEYTSDEQKLQNNGDTYLFMLKKRFPNNNNNDQFSPIGGYQGVFQLNVQQGIYKGALFNPDNKLEQELLNKEITKDLLLTSK